MSGRARSLTEARRTLAIAADLAACEGSADLETPLRALQAALGADRIGLGELRSEGPASAVSRRPTVMLVRPLDLPEAFDAEALAAWSAHWYENPCVVRLQARPEPRPLLLGDFLSERAMRRLRIYPAYRQTGVRGEVAVQVHWEPERVACVTAHRADGRFSERERSLLTRLRPHLRAAHARIEAGREARRRLELLEAGLERGGLGSALVDADGRILLASEGCATLLRRWFDPPRRADRLPAELIAWQGRQRRRADAAPLRRAAGDRALEATLSPVDGGSLLMLRERRYGPPDPAALAAALSLTGRQAQVLALVCRGLADAAIAAELGISVRTVGHHVRHILDRLDVPGRTAAAALALAVEG